MRTIERRVDLDAVKAARVSHQMATFLRKGILVRFWDRPSGGSYIDVTLTHVPRILGSGLARQAQSRSASLELSGSRIELLPQLKAQLLNASDIGEVSPGIHQVRDVCGELGTSHFRTTLLTREGAGQGCRIRHTVASRWEFRHG
jgi:hypothetical protein